MDRWLLGLLAGLVGGAGGALAVHHLLPRGGAAESSGGAPVRAERREEPAGTPDRPTLEARSEDTLAARLERIERLLEGGQGRADTASGATVADPAALAVVRQAVKAELDAHALAEAAKSAEAKDAKAAEPGKKRLALSDAARELDISAAEEADLRRIYGDAQEKYFKILAGPDGDVEAVRRDVEDARKDPKKAPLLMAKYMPKALPRIGEIIQVSMEQNAAVQAAVGTDKAARLESDFDVIEANPIGGGGGLTVGTTIRGPRPPR
jgi:hypothetical protein